MAAVAAMTDEDVTAIAYLEAAEGDSEQALRWAVTDLLRTEKALEQVRCAVSYGYVRAAVAE
ncbi:hypothetical protein [Methylorubrum sp. SB2]|uniref:hypothetical protein n=1 Tax=Methylorubrum subtropicum TaxID=3138812 RepID=UPI00313BFB5E